MKLINKFLYLLSSHEKRRAYLLLGMIITMAFIDMLGIASILPFIDFKILKLSKSNLSRALLNLQVRLVL